MTDRSLRQDLTTETTIPSDSNSSLVYRFAYACRVSSHLLPERFKPMPPFEIFLNVHVLAVPNRNHVDSHDSEIPYVLIAYHFIEQLAACFINLLESQGLDHWFPYISSIPLPTLGRLLQEQLFH